MKMMKSRYFDQTNFLLELFPFLGKERDFALKGGSAINLFTRNLERLSVDIDLSYLPIKDRLKSLEEMSSMLLRFEDYIKHRIPGSSTKQKVIKGTKYISTLAVFVEYFFIKIEINPVLRGFVFPPQNRTLSPEAQQLFKKNVQVQTLSTPDLYAGKICAALDRQHPRDLFDIRILYQNEGLTEEIRKALIVYLLSHPRPIYEMLNPHLIDIDHIFETEFRGMTRIEFSLQQLIETRNKLIKDINEALTENEKNFIISFKKMEPKWDLFEVDHMRKLPAVRWKLYNLSQMDRTKHKIALDKLAQHLEVDIKET